MVIRIDDVRFMDYWFSWFVGLTDGEGSFIIGKDNRMSLRAGYRCHFSIALRDDDKLTLEEIRNTLGMGNVNDQSVRFYDGYNRRPQSIFQVSTIAGCAELVKIFDRYPSRAKKRQDYSVWRAAVIELQKPVAYRNAELLEYYFQEIRRVRKYEKQPALEKPVIVEPQLMIDF